MNPWELLGTIIGWIAVALVVLTILFLVVVAVLAWVLTVRDNWRARRASSIDGEPVKPRNVLPFKKRPSRDAENDRA